MTLSLLQHPVALADGIADVAGSEPQNSPAPAVSSRTGVARPPLRDQNRTELGIGGVIDGRAAGAQAWLRYHEVDRVSDTAVSVGDVRIQAGGLALPDGTGRFVGKLVIDEAIVRENGVGLAGSLQVFDQTPLALRALRPALGARFGSGATSLDLMVAPFSGHISDTLAGFGHGGTLRLRHQVGEALELTGVVDVVAISNADREYDFMRHEYPAFKGSRVPVDATASVEARLKLGQRAFVSAEAVAERFSHPGRVPDATGSHPAESTESSNLVRVTVGGVFK